MQPVVIVLGKVFFLVVCLMRMVNRQAELDSAGFVLARIWLPDLPIWPHESNPAMSQKPLLQRKIMTILEILLYYLKNVRCCFLATLCLNTVKHSMPDDFLSSLTFYYNYVHNYILLLYPALYLAFV